MTRVAAIFTGLFTLLILSGCGLLGSDEENPPVCPREDLRNRHIAGAMVRQPAEIPLYELFAVGGKVKRSGSLSRMTFGDYKFRARSDGQGGYIGWRGATATPIAGLSELSANYFTLNLDFTDDGQAFLGRAVAGVPTSASRLATTGQAQYSGTAKLTVQNLETGGPAVPVTASVSMVVRFGSQLADVRFANFQASSGSLPFDQLNWTNVTVCNVRVGSSGKGGFQTVDGQGRAVNFVGPSAASPFGSAMLDATFYGFDEATARPAEIGGAILVQGDAGAISGLFSTKLRN